MKELIKRAIEASENAYAPYSNYKVGAAILTESNKIYEGANIENASYSPTVCAERVAIFKAVFDNEREFKALAVYGQNMAYPCGVCRQVLSEFCTPQLKIYIVKDENNFEETTLGGLLPKSFTKNNLG